MLRHAQTYTDNENVIIKFSDRPKQHVLEEIKEAGFRWYPKHELWYAQTTDERLEVAENLTSQPMSDAIIQGNCLEVMPELPNCSIDLVITDISDLSGSNGQNLILSFDRDIILEQAIAEIGRLLKQEAYCVLFCNGTGLELTKALAKKAGLEVIKTLHWKGEYCTTKTDIKGDHKALLLAKGSPVKPLEGLKPVMPWYYSGRFLHPSQMSTNMLFPLIGALSSKGGTVLDPFCGSGSTLVASRKLERSYIGIELDQLYAQSAKRRLSF